MIGRSWSEGDGVGARSAGHVDVAAAGLRKDLGNQPLRGRWRGRWATGAPHRDCGRRGSKTLHRVTRDESGSAIPLTLMLGVSLLVLPVMVLVLTVPTWEERTVDAQDAARDAARALVIADNWGDGVSSANDAVAQIVAGDGLPSGDITVSYSGSLDPGGTVTVAVTVVIPAGNVPGLGFVGQLHYTATSTEHVDSYRDSST
jgi:hypothetical protein